MSRVIHFELPANDPDRAAKFYGDVFGWRFQKFPGPQDYWLIATGEAPQPGIDGGMLRRREPSAGTVNTIGVASIDGMIRKVEAAGGKIVVPKMPVPGVGFLAYFVDPEGNTFGMMQPAPSAS